MALFLIVAVFIISNTIKLSVIARRKEIEIMKLVGATNWFIRWPFMIEGAVLGLIGAVIAFFPVYFGYLGIFRWWTESLNMFRMVAAESLRSMIIIVFLTVGCIIGASGSAMSVRKYLDV